MKNIHCRTQRPSELLDRRYEAGEASRALLFDDRELRLPFLCLSHFAPMGIGVKLEAAESLMLYLPIMRVSRQIE